MKIYEVKDILKATLLTGEGQLERTVIGAGGADIMEAFLAAAAKDAVILTGLTGDDVIRGGPGADGVQLRASRSPRPSRTPGNR